MLDVKRVEELKALSSAYPADGTLYFELGQMYFGAERYMDAVYLFTAAITVEHEYAEAYLALGDAYAGYGAMPQAREIYAAGIAVARRTSATQRFLSQFYGRLASLPND